jgi:hypothetical protein
LETLEEERPRPTEPEWLEESPEAERWFAMSRAIDWD